MPKFIIEHLEPFLSKWCLIEYENISKYVGKENLIITNLPPEDHKKLKHLASELQEDSVLTMQLNNTCLLEPQTPKILKPKDSFDYFIFGGILGDYPEQGRTEKYLTSKLNTSKLIKPTTRNLGKKQMSTDTAVLVTKIIAVDKTPFNKIPFIDEPKIVLKQGFVGTKVSRSTAKRGTAQPSENQKEYTEEIILPYRYIKENNKPKIAKKLLDYLRDKDDL